MEVRKYRFEGIDVNSGSTGVMFRGMGSREIQGGIVVDRVHFVEALRGHNVIVYNIQGATVVAHSYGVGVEPDVIIGGEASSIAEAKSRLEEIFRLKLKERS